MLKSLESLQYGFETPKSFQTCVNNHRIVNLALSNYSKLEQFHTGGINALDVDKVDERYLISGAKDGALCIHDLLNTSGKASYTAKLVCEVPRYSRYSHRYSIDTVQWYPFDTGLFVSSGMDSKLKIWDTNCMKPAEVFDMPHKINCHDMSSVASHSLIAIAMEYPQAILLDPRSGSFCHELRAHKYILPCVRWSPSCEYLLATGGVDSKIFLWDIRSAKGYLHSLDQHNGEAGGSRKDLVTAHNGTINGMRFTPDGLYLISCGTDDRVRLWDVALCTNTLVNYGSIVNNNPRRQRYMDVCCDTNPPVLFVPSAHNILMFDLFSGNKISTLVGHFSLVNCCVYRSTVNQVFSGSNDMNILLWTPDTEQEINEKEALTNKRETKKLSLDEDNWSSDGET